MLKEKLAKKSLLNDFKYKYIYSESDDFGNHSTVITDNDFNSAIFITSVTSFVYSILNMHQDKNKKHQIPLNIFENLLTFENYKSIFVSDNSFIVYGYENCSFLWNGKDFKRHEEPQPMYCNYLLQRTSGLSNHRFNPFLHLWIRALQTVCYQWLSIKQDPWKLNLDQLIQHYGNDDDFPYLSPIIEIPIRHDKFNISSAFIHYIRQDANHPLVKKEIRNFEDTPTRNANSAREYIDHLFSIHCKLLVLRIDLGYQKSAYEKLNNVEAYKKIRQDRDRFFANMRCNTLFKHKVGFISKLEYGLDKGFHYHLILFFNGSKTQRDMYLAKQICRYWNVNITNGEGNAFNCHSKKSEYKYQGIGKIDYKNTVPRSHLINYVVRYLVKPDLFARVVIPSNITINHVFERGQFKQCGKLKGRPRA